MNVNQNISCQVSFMSVIHNLPQNLHQMTLPPFATGCDWQLYPISLYKSVYPLVAFPECWLSTCCISRKMIIHVLHIQKVIYPLVAYSECWLSACCISRRLVITCCIPRMLGIHLLHIQNAGYSLVAYPEKLLSTCCISRKRVIHLLHIQNG